MSGLEQTQFDRFFHDYADAFNRSLGETVDVEGIRANFTECFVAAGPNNVTCGRNDESFTENLKKGYTFYKSIGTKRMSVNRVAVTPIDDHHHMAKVFYRADYEKKTGEAVSIDFDVTYLLHEEDGRRRIFAFIAGDELAVFRQHGLIPPEFS